MTTEYNVVLLGTLFDETVTESYIVEAESTSEAIEEAIWDAMMNYPSSDDEWDVLEVTEL